MAKRRKSRTKKQSLPESDPPLTGGDYLRLTQRPLVSLMFLLPLLIFYETGSFLLESNLMGTAAAPLAAHWMLDQMFALFGATPYYLPGLTVIVILVAWHVANRDPWRVDWRVVGLMALESVVLALPLLAMNNLFAPSLAAPQSDVPPTPGMVMLATAATRERVHDLLLGIGAGIYEELVFRLMVISVCSIILIDVLQLPRRSGHLIAVAVSAALFAAAHHLGFEAFEWWKFGFRAVAGGYLAACFVWRGFGVAVGCHAAYDAIVVLLDIARAG
jgi:membrane protease YdiL (CAAX protease family)